LLKKSLKSASLLRSAFVSVGSAGGLGENKANTLELLGIYLISVLGFKYYPAEIK
jgi:hypothetical protein